ncbi:MAG: hypothetical protein JXA78_00845 [Anaerolineales bacterium]|nr:hypothetical protein [Anaerolineales bacterium]
MNKLTFVFRVLVWIFVLVAMTGCNLGASEGTPTLDVTQAYQTVEARLTQAAIQTPSSTPMPTDTQTPTSVATTAIAVTTAPPSATVPASACDQASAGAPIDVTIPDDTKMQAGQKFTKTWRLINSGTCTWTTAYSVAFFSGDQMGAPASVALPNEVAPGQSVDVSVDMVAPQDTGTYQGDWKLRNAANAWFGIGGGGGLPFWVRIVVGQATTGTPTITSTTSTTETTPTATSTTSTGVLVSVATNLIPTDKINLDTGQLNAGGADLSYEFISDEGLFLVPTGVSLIASFGSATPSRNDCQSADLSAGAVPLENLFQGAYLCYRTDQGLYGWARLLSLDTNNATLTIQITTWSQE